MADPAAAAGRPRDGRGQAEGPISKLAAVPITRHDHGWS
jgi:hypothetical protein